MFKFYAWLWTNYSSTLLFSTADDSPERDIGQGFSDQRRRIQDIAKKELSDVAWRFVAAASRTWSEHFTPVLPGWHFSNIRVLPECTRYVVVVTSLHILQVCSDEEEYNPVEDLRLSLQRD